MKSENFSYPNAHVFKAKMPFYFAFNKFCVYFYFLRTFRFCFLCTCKPFRSIYVFLRLMDGEGFCVGKVAANHFPAGGLLFRDDG